VITARAFLGKKYAVYGLARSGLATASALLESGAAVTAWDREAEARAKAPEGTRIENLDEADLSKFDSLVVTPGLPINRHPIARRADEQGLEIIGDIELFARARAELPAHKVVGITGTNGKSTTTALIHHILRTAAIPSLMGGNIGLPILAQEPLPTGGVYVLELSSYQIDLTLSLDCEVSVLLNITPDHLDRYQSFDAYAEAKARLFKMQSDDHEAVIIGDDRETCRIAASPWMKNRGEHHLHLLHGKLGLDQSSWPTLQGPHNAQNTVAAIETCRLLGIGEGEIALGLRTYPGLPHRMERIREKDGVLFVNDSKATNPTATAPALAAFERIRWILGGQAKTHELDECAPHFSHVASAYVIGDAAEMFEALLTPHMPVKNCGKLDLAVREAAADAVSGDTVMLSPACASFDQFRDFEDRGDQFRALVGAL
jgi:UDP-N-acetylmuramoylalanine--D-glutamate ligase